MKKNESAMLSQMKNKLKAKKKKENKTKRNRPEQKEENSCTNFNNVFISIDQLISPLYTERSALRAVAFPVTVIEPLTITATTQRLGGMTLASVSGPEKL